MDKTGTITEPGMEVEQVISLRDAPVTEILTAICAGMEPENAVIAARQHSKIGIVSGLSRNCVHGDICSAVQNAVEGNAGIVRSIFLYIRFSAAGQTQRAYQRQGKQDQLLHTYSFG